MDNAQEIMMTQLLIERAVGAKDSMSGMPYAIVVSVWVIALMIIMLKVVDCTLTKSDNHAIGPMLHQPIYQPMGYARPQLAKKEGYQALPYYPSHVSEYSVIPFHAEMYGR